MVVRILLPARNLLTIVCGATLAACTSLIGLDGEYVLYGEQDGNAAAASAAGGANASGGHAGSSGGGRVSTGGLPSNGGSGGPNIDSGATPDARGDVIQPEAAPACSSCGANQKCCEESCVNAVPFFGCGMSGCDPCTDPPAFAQPYCDAEGQCAWICLEGYERVGDVCEPITGGTGGAPAVDAGNNPPVCNPRDCPTCLPIGFGCCRDDGECGCSWAAAAYCF